MSFPSALENFLHEYVPHDDGAIYLASAMIAGTAVVAVYLRTKLTKSANYLEDRWIGRTAAFAAPFPVYFLMLLAPIDPDLLKVMMSDSLIVALAGLYGLSEVINDVRSMAGRARQAKAGEIPRRRR